MSEKVYCVDASGGPYYNTGEKIAKGQVLGKDETGMDVVSSVSGTVCAIAFDGKTHCFKVKIKKE